MFLTRKLTLITERPIRNYELLADVSASWNKDKLLNAFVIKQTPLAQLLSRFVSHSRQLKSNEICLPKRHRLYLPAPLPIAVGLNGRANEENGVSVGWNFANTACGYRSGTR